MAKAKSPQVKHMGSVMKQMLVIANDKRKRSNPLIALLFLFFFFSHGVSNYPATCLRENTYPYYTIMLHNT